MPASFRKGSKVRQRQPAPVQGEVVRMGMVEDELGYLVVTEEGNEAWFRESDLVAVDEEPTEE